jgi:hypothetical protein
VRCTYETQSISSRRSEASHCGGSAAAARFFAPRAIGQFGFLPYRRWRAPLRMTRPPPLPSGGFSGRRCLPCPPGGFSGRRCLPCPPGGFSGRRCLPCPPGGFSAGQSPPDLPGEFQGGCASLALRVGFQGGAASLTLRVGFREGAALPELSEIQDVPYMRRFVLAHERLDQLGVERRAGVRAHADAKHERRAGFFHDLGCDAGAEFDQA